MKEHENDEGFKNAISSLHNAVTLVMGGTKLELVRHCGLSLRDADEVLAAAIKEIGTTMEEMIPLTDYED